jgi:adenosylcobinamide amidohydrolase
MRLEIHWRTENGKRLPAALWRADSGCRMISSGITGGGIGPRDWVLNAQVPGGYSRMDPAAHLAEIAEGLNLTGTGVGMLTAAQVTHVVERDDEGVCAAATVGLRIPTWAAVPPGAVDPELAPIVRTTACPAPGTINVVVTVPVALSDAAYVNAVTTATEAKTQAVIEAGYSGTGTATDAICVVAPRLGETPQDFTGPRSLWGARIARAVHAAVYAGAVNYMEKLAR